MIKKYFNGFDPKTGEFVVPEGIQFLFPRYYEGEAEGVGERADAPAEGVRSTRSPVISEAKSRQLEQILLHLHFALKHTLHTSRSAQSGKSLADFVEPLK